MSKNKSSSNALRDQFKPPKTATIAKDRQFSEERTRFGTLPKMFAWLRTIRQDHRLKIPRPVPPEAFYGFFARRIVDLGKCLVATGMVKKIDDLTHESKAKEDAIQMLRLGVIGSRKLQEIAGLLAAMVESDECDETWSWLGWRLEQEICRDRIIPQPAPTPPAGWEGPHYRPVQNLSELAEWLSEKLGALEMACLASDGKHDPETINVALHNLAHLAGTVGAVGIVSVAKEAEGYSDVDRKFRALKFCTDLATEKPTTESNVASTTAEQTPIISPNKADSPTSKAIGPPFLAAKDLALEMKLREDAVETFLRRYREKYPDCYVATESPRRNEPQYLYRVVDVKPAIAKHFAKSQN